MDQYIRIACAVPAVQVGNVEENVSAICAQLAQADGQKADVAVFPELAVTGYSCQDLFFQNKLLNAAVAGLRQICQYTRQFPQLTAVVGLPLQLDGQLYNCAAVLRAGLVLGIVPKTYIPNHGEFSEKRWFASGAQLQRTQLEASALGFTDRQQIPVGTDLLFCLSDQTRMGVEICEDLWAPVPVSSGLALSGAQVIVNPSASNETIEKRGNRRSMLTHQSRGCSCIYAFCSAGAGESSQDTVFSGHCIVAENGRIHAENAHLAQRSHLLVTDGDLELIRGVRLKNTTFRDAAGAYLQKHTPRLCGATDALLRSDGSLYPVVRDPFVPADADEKNDWAMAAFEIQTAGLMRRLSAIGAKAVIGVSGGLDSTLALLVCVEAMRRLDRPVTDVHAITMPCFGTSDRTLSNACQLMELLGVTSRKISIREAVTAHFQNIGHDPGVHDATYENAQARERTQILMDYAGKVGGIVVGTGDLSELALGWCTYNADHMSMYNVNGSVPKTMIPSIILAAATLPTYAPAEKLLQDVIATPISPELLPPEQTGSISQHTESLVGPYVLHDFFLYHMLQNGFAPDKIYRLACRAFSGQYDAAVIKKWLKVFYRRFFSQQFKRNCQPDGVKIGAVSLNPRCDWHMPSDGSGQLWLEDIEQ